MLNEAKNSEEKAKKAMVDAARLADELRAEQEHAHSQEKMRKGLEFQVKELQARLNRLKAMPLRQARNWLSALKAAFVNLKASWWRNSPSRRRSEELSIKVRIKELTFQSDEDKKNYERLQDLAEKLQQKIKTYRRQIEAAEEIAALN